MIRDLNNRLAELLRLKEEAEKLSEERLRICNERMELINTYKNTVDELNCVCGQRMEIINNCRIESRDQTRLIEEKNAYIKYLEDFINTLRKNPLYKLVRLPSKLAERKHAKE